MPLNIDMRTTVVAVTHKQTYFVIHDIAFPGQSAQRLALAAGTVTANAQHFSIDNINITLPNAAAVVPVRLQAVVRLPHRNAENVTSAPTRLTLIFFDGVTVPFSLARNGIDIYTDTHFYLLAA